ncbi:MAG: hypothetical protein JSV38_06465 [Desulfobacterales bacterium]|nr:MAG: hypothetical protein JSV38_06465 [Desulfobacterales bacterium]
MSSALWVGVMFGLSAGFAPGPLLTLVITQTLRHGIKEGILTASAPVLTDAPIILKIHGENPYAAWIFLKNHQKNFII